MINGNEEINTVNEQLDGLHNRMLILDHNYTRVKKLHDNEVQAISDLQQFKIDAQNAIEILKSDKSELVINIDQLIKERDSLLSDVELSRKQFIALNDQINSKQGIYDAKESELVNREANVMKKENELETKSRYLDSQQKSLEEKHNKIKALKDTI